MFRVEEVVVDEQMGNPTSDHVAQVICRHEGNTISLLDHIKEAVIPSARLAAGIGICRAVQLFRRSYSGQSGNNCSQTEKHGIPVCK